MPARFLIVLRRPREPEDLSKHQYLTFITSTAVFDIKPVTVFNDGRELQNKAKEA